MQQSTQVFRQIETFLLVRLYQEGVSPDVKVSVVLTVDHEKQEISITPEPILAYITQPSRSASPTKTSFNLLNLQKKPDYWLALAKLIEHATTEGHARLDEVRQLFDKPCKELF